MKRFVDVCVEPLTASFSDGTKVKLRDKGLANCIECNVEYPTSLGGEGAKKKPWRCRSCAYKGIPRQTRSEDRLVTTLPRRGNFYISAVKCLVFDVQERQICEKTEFTIPCLSCNEIVTTSVIREKKRDVKCRFRCRSCRKDVWDSNSPRLHKKRQFTCLKCDITFTTTLGAVQKLPVDTQGMCRKCRYQFYTHDRRQTLQIDHTLPVVGEVILSREEITAYNISTRRELFSYDRFTLPCIRCEKDYQTTIGYERVKEHVWHCKSCASLVGWEVPGHKEKLSQVMKDYCAINPPSRSCQRATVLDCSGAQITLRSNYERRFIEHLNSRGLTWDYEIRGFPVHILDEKGALSICTYWPDFYVRELDLWVEIKGYFYPQGRLKWNAFAVSYPKHRKVIIFSEELNALEQGNLQLEEIPQQIEAL